MEKDEGGEFKLKITPRQQSKVIFTAIILILLGTAIYILSFYI